MQEYYNIKELFDPSVYIGKDISSVTLLELLGQGAMGAVYVAYQKSLKRKIAVKIFPKLEVLPDRMKVQFRDEAETVAVLNHPNIAPVFDMGETDEFLYIMMQLIEGEDLRSLIRRHSLHPVLSRRTIPPQSAVKIMVSILDALEYSHNEQVIHQDIKPANILVENRSGRAYLVDFGIARTPVTESQSQIVFGTPFYMPPEQISGQQTDQRSDIYAAGMVLYEALAGKLPLKPGPVEQLVHMKMNKPDQIFTCSPSQCSQAINSELERIILKAIAPKCQERYQSCLSFKADLKKYAEQHFKDLVS